MVIQVERPELQGFALLYSYLLPSLTFICPNLERVRMWQANRMAQWKQRTLWPLAVCLAVKAAWLPRIFFLYISDYMEKFWLLLYNILEIIYIILGFLTIPWLSPKDTEPHAPSVPKAKLGYMEPRAASVPKAKLGHTEPRAPSVPKAKLGHSNCVRHRVILPLVMAILGFLIIPWLGPKDTEPHAT